MGPGRGGAQERRRAVLAVGGRRHEADPGAGELLYLRRQKLAKLANFARFADDESEPVKREYRSHIC